MSYAFLGFVDILRDILGGLINTILKPVLTVVVEFAFDTLGGILKDMFSNFAYAVMTILLKLVDFLQTIFDVFSGTRYVYYEGERAYLLDAFLQMDEIKSAFYLITFLAAAIALLFTIYATAKSMRDMTMDNKNPIGKVLGRSLKAMFAFLLVPFMVYALVQIASVTMVYTSRVISEDPDYAGPSVGTIIFLTCSLDSAKVADRNKSPSFQDELRNRYYNPNAYDKAADRRYYYNKKQVMDDFDFAEFDYIVAIICACFVALVLIGAILLSIRRIFEILVLYLVSPFFVAAMALDDGAMFQKWRDMFVAKVFSVLGIVISMKIYLLLVPYLCGNTIQLMPGDSFEARFIDAMLKMFVIVGGAYACYKAQHLMLQILNPEAAMMAEQSSGFAAGMIMGAVGMLPGVGALATRAAQGVTTKGKESKGKGSSGGGSGGGRSAAHPPQMQNQSSQQFTGR